MYSVLDYGFMTLDGVRMSAYARAIERVVRPGSVVVDLGAGTGVLSLLAARAGASRVYAVDVNPCVWIARELAVENGFADRISVYEANSFDLTLPEKVDVLVCDMRGKHALSGDHLAAVHDATSRWLKPGGAAVPVRDRLFVGVLQGDYVARDWAGACESVERLGFTANAVRSSILNSVQDDRRRTLASSELLSTAASWATVDYGAPPPAVFEGSVVVHAVRRGIARGLAIWFEATLFEDIGFASTPGQDLAYARAILPLSEPVSLSEGDRIELSIGADARGDRWSWQGRVQSESGSEKARFRQASFLGMPTSPAALVRASAHATPRLSQAGLRFRRILDAMDGSHTVQEITDEIVREAPQSDAERVASCVRDAMERFAQ